MADDDRKQREIVVCGRGYGTARWRAAAVVAACAVTVTLAGCGGDPGSAKSGGAAPSAASSTQGLQPTAPGASIVAEAKGSSVEIHSAENGPVASTLANPQPSGAPLVLLVVQQTQDWLQVLLPVRPNGSTGWVRAGDVTLTQHAYRIQVRLGAHRITVFNNDAVVLSEPIGVGRSGATPTPLGHFYTKELLKSPNPNGDYGPYAYGLSGYSTVLTKFNGGDGVIGIHGTNDPASLGKDVSHGCIRMSNAGISKLAGMLPLGVPVDIEQ